MILNRNLPVLKTNKSYKKQFVFLLATTFSGILVSNYSAASILKNSHKDVIDHVWQIVYREFLDTNGNFEKSNWIKIRKDVLSKKYSDSNEAYDAIRNMLLKLDDPYTRFLDPKEFSQMRIDTSGELTGVGIQIIKDKDSDELIIISPIEGTPAYEAGIKAGDKILSIDNVSSKGLNIDDAVKLIRGERGTKVKLEILRNGKSFYKSLSREKIEIKSVTSKLNKTKGGFLIGYVRIKQFNANASKEMKTTLKDLETKNVSGYVLDLRSNPGGLLESSIDISRQFIDKGIIVSTLSKDGLKEIKRGNGKAITQKPLIVLVNQGSASASEIVSGAIRDNNRGKLVGKKTFGKGLVQSLRTLVDGSGLTVTVAKYLTPNGTDINKFGITPDIEVKMNSNAILQREIGTRKDRQYRTAEKELIKLIKTTDLSSKFEPDSANLLSVFKKKPNNIIYSLN